MKAAATPYFMDVPQLPPSVAKATLAANAAAVDFARCGQMLAFLDFEASSLNKDSYPIEVGWVFEDGAAETHLIRPAPDWTDWDPAAERIHGLSRERPQAQGEPAEAVGLRLLDRLQGHDLFVTAPSWDGKWLSVLLRAAGLPRHALRVQNADVAHAAAVIQALGSADRAPEILAEARQGLADEPIRHRALADARQELRLWREVQRLAAAYASNSMSQ
jgi:hypothetical protein